MFGGFFVERYLTFACNNDGMNATAFPSSRLECKNQQQQRMESKDEINEDNVELHGLLLLTLSYLRKVLLSIKICMQLSNTH